MTGKPLCETACCYAGASISVSFAIFYRRQDRPAPRRGGPKPIIPDDAPLGMFREEGHRKPYYRLKHERKIKVSANPVLRIMRKNNLLPPNRAPQGKPNIHDGTIITTKTKRPGLAGRFVKDLDIATRT